MDEEQKKTRKIFTIKSILVLLGKLCLSAYPLILTVVGGSVFYIGYATSYDIVIYTGIVILVIGIITLLDYMDF